MIAGIDHVLPQDIEKRSFEIIGEELAKKEKNVPEELKDVVYRVIHTTADFEYADTLIFSEEALEKGLKAIEAGAHIITDTTMALSGINKRVLSRFGGEVHCFIADADVAKEAKEREAMGHFGMIGMEERARIIGAQLKVLSKPGEGTRVHLRLERKALGKKEQKK